MLVVLQAKSSVSYKRHLFLTILPFLTVKAPIIERSFVFLHSERVLYMRVAFAHMLLCEWACLKDVLHGLVGSHHGVDS